MDRDKREINYTEITTHTFLILRDGTQRKNLKDFDFVYASQAISGTQ